MGFSLLRSIIRKLISTCISTKREVEESEENDDHLLLPAEIIIDILSRLPVESVLECGRVCKTWRNHLLALNDTNYFANMHLRRHGGLLLQLQQLDDDDQYHNQSNAAAAAAKVGLILCGKRNLYYGDYDNDDDDENNIHDEKFSNYKMKTSFTKINHPLFDTEPADIVGSCNGLICLSVRRRRLLGYNNRDLFYICNPITREYIYLPGPIMDDDDPENLGIGMLCGFGYLQSTNEYKVVTMYYCRNDTQLFLGRVEVYTLGDGNGWRNKGEITYSWGPICFISKGVFANGALHWLDIKDGKIIAFDLADEEFHSFPSPPPCDVPFSGVPRRFPQELCVLGGWLCLVHKREDACIDIWSIKKTKSISNDDDMKEQEYQSWSWSREFSIRTKGRGNSICQPIALAKRGEILMWYNFAYLVAYDPRSTTSEKLGDLGRDLHCCYGRATSHINSFLSLKALGEDAKNFRTS
ncbi:F-box domain [Macleaya cordata]|uniref:F-box domain n=1 Tax=Macleaya cordata TaxID=56857 RepID=A0A200Q6V3_MACCD|nr:F-box domain [Macleaya cordata]